MRDWPRRALTQIEIGPPCALVTVLAIEGSTPREPGARMLIWANGQAGTIGGGNLEHQATIQARRMLAQGEAVGFAVQDYPLGPLLSQCCGGRVRLMLERLDARDADWLAEVDRLVREGRPYLLRRRITGDNLVRSVERPPPPLRGPPPPVGEELGGAPALNSSPSGGGGPPEGRWRGHTCANESGKNASRLTVNGRPTNARDARPGPGDEIVERSPPPLPHLLLFGAGHVGVAIARVMEPLPLRVSWFDSRPEAALEPGVRVAEPAKMARVAEAGAPYTLILTHDHALDYALTLASLRGDGGYLGLIGSKTKRARFMRRLRDEGVSEHALLRIVCPIGLPGLMSKAPEVIAVSVAADLLLRLEAARRPLAKETVLAGL